MRLKLIMRLKQGFILPTAIFLLLMIATLGAFIVQVTTVSYVASAESIQSARAYQATKLGIESGLYAAQITRNCTGGTFDGPPGLTDFKIVWTCQCTPFTEKGGHNEICQITSTACSLRPANCPSTDTATLQNYDYVERQQVVLTEITNKPINPTRVE